MNQNRQSNTMQKHKKTSPKSEKKKPLTFECDVVDCKFKTQSQAKFINHVINHIPKEFQCEECN